MVWRRELGVLVNLQDVVDGALGNSLSAVAAMLVQPRTSRRTGAELDLAAWMDTDALVGNELPGAWLELPEVSDEDAAELEAALKRHEVQGALQALLAARLTDAPEEDAAWAREVLAARLAAREAVRLALSGSGAPAARRVDRRSQSPGTDEAPRALGSVRVDQWESAPKAASSRYAEQLSGYFDDKISALVASLEARVGFAGLAQVRAEAYNARIVALLGAIERQVAALADPGRGGEAEAEWLARYRRQAQVRHGFLYPPDFERRRRIPAGNIYVPTEIIATRVTTADGVREFSVADSVVVPAVTGTAAEFQHPLAGLDEHRAQAQPPRLGDAPSLNVFDLVTLIGRTVLLGDPGGGKTTATNVLANFFAREDGLRVPFVVTLREYAAKTPLEWSVAEHIGQNLKAVYQSPVPDGLVERLLVTGRAVVIFDGLDELLDTSHRRNVSERVEQFCSAYPLTPVLVTSRVVGYDQARLDDSQFSCYQLGRFKDDEVAKYVGKWFASQDGASSAEATAKAKAFLAESSNATDLRANPLLLSLMCILYRGAGSLPVDRAGIYARCAELLLRKWDDQRDLYRKVRADHLVEPAIRYLAWWLFTREDSRTAATERELVAEATGFLHQRGFESEEEARAAAREFVEFCRGRMWVFSDVGTTSGGEALYAFTHRTFLEYFAAGHLAAISDTPEDLGRELAQRIDVGGWQVVGELAVKMKSDAADRGADRIYATVLEHLDLDRDDALSFLAGCLDSSRPSPTAVRRLTSAVFDDLLSNSMVSWSGPDFAARADRLTEFLTDARSYQMVVADELSNRVAAMVASGESDAQVAGLRFVLEMASVFRQSPQRTWADEQISRYGSEIVDIASRDRAFRVCAVVADAISAEQALAMPGYLSALLGDGTLVTMCWAMLGANEDEILINALEAIGRFLMRHEQLPWLKAPLYDEPLPATMMTSMLDSVRYLDEFSGLGLAATIAIGTELSDLPASGEAYRLAELPMPVRFRRLFRDWTAGRVEFAEITSE